MRIIEEKNIEKGYEFNSWGTSGLVSGNIRIFDLFSQYNPEELQSIFSDPMANNKEIRILCRRAYNLNPIVSNAIDYIVALPCLAHILISKNQSLKSKFEDILVQIDDKKIIRDALFRDCNDGACYYYLEIENSVNIMSKYENDYEIESALEVNEAKTSKFNLISLPTDYVKIRGYKNNRPVIAFNLRFFDDYSGSSKENKLKTFPKEIRNGYEKFSQGKTIGNWLILDNDKTIVHKIRSDKREPYGRPLAMSVLADIFYNDYLTKVKRGVLNEVNNNIFYQTLPTAKDGRCALTESQQKTQHNTIRDAIMVKNNLNGTSFFTVAGGTTIGHIDTNVDILNEEIEPKLNSKIAMGLGYALGLLDGESGSYSSQQNNLEMLFSKVYSWVTEIAREIEYVINKNLFGDKRVTLYYLPTSLTNKEKFANMCKELYMSGNGSKSMWIAATGIDVEAYVSLMEMEQEQDWDNRFTPHPTAYTRSDDNSDVGRPSVDDATDESTLASQDNGSNKQPKPKK